MSDTKKAAINAAIAETPVVNYLDQFEIEDMIAEISADNTPEYNLLKFCEELTELQERLLKSHLKIPSKKPTKVDIAEELGDVFIRFLGYIAHDEELITLVEERVQFKTNKLYNYYMSGNYKKGV